MKDIFTPQETVNSSLVIPKLESQFNQLNKVQSISHIGEIAVPILYSQTSSNGYTINIPISASNQEVNILPDFEMSTRETNMSNIFSTNISNFNIPIVKITSSAIYDPIYIDSTNYPILGSGIISASNLTPDYKISWDIRIPSTTPSRPRPDFLQADFLQADFYTL